MYAIVETGGKQYQVEEGRYVDVELLDGEKDAKIVFDKIVMIVNGKSFYITNLKRLLFTNKDLKKVTEKNKATDKALQELWFLKSEHLLKKLLQQKNQLLSND